MELSKKPAPAPGTPEASLLASPKSAQPSIRSTPYPANWGARVPISEYLIVPMGGQAGASRPVTANLPEVRPPSRVSLRPPQQVMNVQPASPGIFGSQPSVSALGKEMASSSKVQTLESVPSICSVQNEPLQKALLQSFESMRAKFREALPGALGLDSDHLNAQQSASNVPLSGSAGENKHADDIVVGASESASKLSSDRDLTSDIDTVSLNEPESKRQKTSDELINGGNKGVIQNMQNLPFRIEEELFKLFGGVNKKYKEKGRSLLFNLKDKSNPVLRERVLSGDITPKFLCSMTTEELASKELSDWRLAKAEELAKMVVLPNTEVDIRRLVRKTHKGEFHVEVEESDGISVEVELGGDLLTHLSKCIEGQTNFDNRANVHGGDKESDNSLPDEVGDTVKKCMLDDSKDTENLLGIMPLAGFTKALDSKLHYENQSTETTVHDLPNKADIMMKPERYHRTKDKTFLSEFELTSDAPSLKEKCRSRIESSTNVSVPSLCPAKHKGDMLIKTTSKMMASEKLDTSGNNVHSNATPDGTLTHGSLWEGTIQFTISAQSNVVAIFRSGEKPSTNDWSRFVEIKGTVKLTVFQEFLEQLPNSRRRAITVTQLRWREDSLKSGRQHLLQAIDSYIADERVGLVKLTKGVDLYLCPCQGKAAQILAEHLPKEHFGSLPVDGEASAIGVVVWQRPHGSTRMSTRHVGSNRPSVPISRKQQAVIASSVALPPELTKNPSSHFIHSNECHRLSAAADVSGAVKHDDDLPACNFISVLNTSGNVVTSNTPSSPEHGPQHVPVISRPPNQAKQLVDKYSSRYVSSQPWDDKDDQVRRLVHKYGNKHVSSQACDDNADDLHSPDQVKQLVHKYGDKYVSAPSWAGKDDDLLSSDQVKQLVHKYGDRHVSAQPWNGKDDDLQLSDSDQVRQLVHKYGNRYDPAQPWDRNDDNLRSSDQLSHLVHKFDNKYVSDRRWDGDSDDFWPPPPGQVRHLVRRYGNMYSAHPWDSRDDEPPELYRDPIQCSHQRTWHPEPLLPLIEHDQERDHYYYRRRHLQEHYDGMLPEVNIGPEQHVMAARRRWDYESSMHCTETHCWRSSTHRHFTGMPVEPMHDFVREPYFGVEHDMVAPRPMPLFGVRRPWPGTWEPPYYM